MSTSMVQKGKENSSLVVFLTDIFLYFVYPWGLHEDWTDFKFFQVKGTDYNTPDGTCVRDYIDVTDLVDAHVKALEKAMPNKVGIYNVGTGKGRANEMNLFLTVHSCVWKICYTRVGICSEVYIPAPRLDHCFQVDQ